MVDIISNHLLFLCALCVSRKVVIIRLQGGRGGGGTWEFLNWTHNLFCSHSPSKTFISVCVWSFFNFFHFYFLNPKLQMIHNCAFFSVYKVGSKDRPNIDLEEKNKGH